MGVKVRGMVGRIMGEMVGGTLGRNMGTQLHAVTPFIIEG